MSNLNEEGQDIKLDMDMLINLEHTIYETYQLIKIMMDDPAFEFRYQEIEKNFVLKIKNEIDQYCSERCQRDNPELQLIRPATTLASNLN